jgi:hypothetical protein
MYKKLCFGLKLVDEAGLKMGVLVQLLRESLPDTKA